MKKVCLVVCVVVFAMACNNNADTSNSRDSIQQNNAVADSMPATRSGDTSSYEQMPNRIGDSIGK